MMKDIRNNTLKVLQIGIITLLVLSIKRTSANPLTNFLNGNNRNRSSLLPTPSGRFYGIPFDTKTLDRTYLPFSASGKCEAGTVYKITNVEDLPKYFADLECIFHAGIAPSKVPEGTLYRKVLGALNSRIFAPIGYLWYGKFAMKVDCDEKPKYFSFNNILGMPLFPAYDYIGPINEVLAPGEIDDGKDTLIIDYTADFKSVCPDYESFVEKEYSSLPLRRRALNGFWPTNTVYDALRLIGRQKDNGLIFLGKTLLRDYFRDDKQSATICYWSIVSYDPEVSLDFEVGQALEPQERSFTYVFPGLIDIILRVLPLDNLLTTPLRTTRKLFSIVNEFARSGIVYAGEFLNSYRTLFRDTFLFQRNFREGRDSRKISSADNGKELNGFR